MKERVLGAARAGAAPDGAVHGAIALWVRADWRRRSRQLVALALLAGLTGAVVLTAVAGARRTATSFGRLVVESQAADVAADVGAVDPEIVDKISGLPMVDVAAEFTVVFALVDGVEADLAIWAPRDDRMGTQIERDRILRGRRPAADRPDEVVIDESTAAAADLDVGNEVSIATLTPEQVSAEDYFPARGPVLRVEVVGVSRGVDDIIEGAEGGFMASPALYDTIRGEVDEFTLYLVVGLVDGASPADFDAAVADLIPSSQQYETFTLQERSKAARGTISAVASGLAVFAVVAALAAIVVVGQAVGRHVAGAQGDAETLRGLGITSAGRYAAFILVALPAALGGAGVAAMTAWLASPIMPIGFARRAEPNAGRSADWIVLGTGAIAIIALVLLAATITAIWITRARVATRRPPEPSRVSAALSRAGAGPVPATGARLALDRRAPALPVRSAVGGVAAAIVGTVAVLTFSASVDRLLDTPARWGYGWDLLLNFTADDVDAAAERVVTDDRLTAAARWDAGFSYIGSEGLRAYGLTPLEGDIGFALRSGRQPVSPGEVVIGTATAKRLGVDLGDPIGVAPEPRAADTASVIVVGTALFPDDGEGSFADAVGFFGPAFAEHAIAPDLFEASQVIVRVAPGLDVDSVAASLGEENPDSVSGESLPAPPGEVASLDGVRSLPRWLAVFVAMLGVASLGHVLLTTVWRRRRELATLRSLGLTPRQTVACIIWQAATIAVIGLLIGVPVGLIAGDAAWSAVTDPIGVATDTDRPPIVYAATVCIVLLAAALVAVLPGWRAARLRLTDALRVE